MHTVRIDRGKRLCDEPDRGHNHYHPDITPIAEIAEGEEIALDTRDALDGRIGPQTTVADFANLDVGAVHPLAGPVFVKGAMPGDILEIEFTPHEPSPLQTPIILPKATASLHLCPPGWGFPQAQVLALGFPDPVSSVP